jgi:hypothetical protein
MATIRIVSTPPGEAPLEIRQAWIGLVLPLHRPTPKTTFSFGVLSGPKSFFEIIWAIVTGRADKSTVYLVNAKTAIESLEITRPEAAAWWRENAPHLLEPHRIFGFTSTACEPLTHGEGNI